MSKYAHDMMLTAGTENDMNPWEWIDFYGDGLGAAAGITAALVAILSLISAASDSRARSQPMVTAELRSAVDSERSADLVITNLGPTPARDIKVRFEPELVLPEDSDRVVASFVIQRYSTPIPVLNPGQVLSNTWWSGKDVGGAKLVNREPLPDEFTVHVSYRGRRSRWSRRRKDSFPLTMDSLFLTTYAESSNSTKGRIESIDASLKKLAATTASIATMMNRPAKSDGNNDVSEILRLTGFGESTETVEPDTERQGTAGLVGAVRKLVSRLF